MHLEMPEDSPVSSPIFSAEGSFLGEDTERGAVILEWAIVALGMILGLITLFDTGNGLYTYMMMAHVAAEGARTGGKVPALEEPGAFTDEDIGATAAEISDCESGSPSTLACGHFLIASRMRLMTTTLPVGVDPTTISFRTQLFPAGGGAGAENGTVKVEVSVFFDGILFDLPIRASRQAPYLFRS